ncbi:potassium transporter KefB [Formosa sp. S-31]|uniref:potassium transporter KefB n=1 Tax=Formosa sp. S-31 TaxID=2790949 RepID=UPI003EBA9C0B
MQRNIETFKLFSDTKTLKFYGLFGGVTGAIIITAFVFSVDTPKPEWPVLWRIKPLLLTPFVAACGGLAVYAIQTYSKLKNWNAILSGILSLVVFIITLWFGIVLGLNGTLWD